MTESNYGRYFLESMRPKEGARDEYTQYRAFYERLFREGTLLFDAREARSSICIPVSPAVRHMGPLRFEV